MLRIFAAARHVLSVSRVFLLFSAVLLFAVLLALTGPVLSAAPPANDAFTRALGWVADLPVRESPAPAASLKDTPSASPVVLQLRVIDGEGVVYGLGTRATRGLTVQVTDETGRPVAGAAVSFKLPEDGPTGTFENGSRNEVVITKVDGHATVWGMRWNKTAGIVQVRITAAKDPARAGAITQVSLSPQVAAESKHPSTPSYGSTKKWTTILLVVAGVAGGGLVAGMVSGNSSAAPLAVASTAPKIGTPTIILGKP